MSKPTIIDLAKAAGVSPTTISHAFSGRRPVDTETKERILKLAREIGYHPSSMARGLRSGRTGTIAIASSMPFSVAAGPSRLGFLMEIAASAAMSALTRNIALCLIPPLAPESNLASLGFDGVILVEPTSKDPLIAHFEARHTPIVSIGKVAGRTDIPAVDLRSHETARMMLDHLRDMGSRQVALIVGAADRTSQLETEAAYVAFCDEGGMSPRIVRLDEDGGEQAAQDATRDLLAASPHLDGLLVPVDAFASGALAAAHAAGRRVPQDLRLATRYDGLRAKLARPGLTAVDLGLAEVASLAVELLLARLDGTPANVMAPRPRLVVRRSSDPTAPAG
ncbi:substrate-binding domain-containing protein [Paracoccus siganidrum]|uniref:LacI family DNA-binding transcriptional regulator n=1 Tax=Paracoccus siganidrum TaxID=1276757 RepID=A0A419A8Y4_9RHOB|nr:substrate-binding domain-containing protein [Paracoccus siganidrum]RJL18489.1 LacI family DNA-binding transcriptional regulator [Paracoccus siganidrum]RMC39789.1 LacI family transcriptional regulator [Paracoccus siganidrum]